jgi:probable DNA metabolism protein
MDYLYDGTFEGLLTCIYYHYKKVKATGIYEMKSYQQSIINDFEIIETEVNKAEVVSDAIVNKISREAYIHVYYCFLSGNEKKDNIILVFLIFAFKYGKETMNFYSHEKVLPINEISLKVSREVHRFLGILRFTDIDGKLYAKFSPDNDILILMIEHFADRYKYEKFIIHDERRNKAVIYSNDLWQMIDVNFIDGIDGISELGYSQNEKLIQCLWKQYFTDMAIKERENTNLQFQFVPARYRKNITEFL